MSEYIDGDMDAAGRARIERHAGDCPDCRDLLSSLQTMVATLGSMPGQAGGSVAGVVLAGVQERLGSGDDRPA
jgi:anti-sigma factor RsiW